MVEAQAAEAPRRVLLIVNEHSRRGQDVASAAEAALGGRQIAVLRHSSKSRDHVSELVRSAGHDVDAVVVGGGDGTLNAAAPGLLEKQLRLGILPLGTANDLARTLGIPIELEQAIAVIADGRTRRIDLGDVNGHPYFNVASLGLGVDLTRALTRDAKRRWGLLGYAIAGFRVINRLQAFHAEITVGGKTHVSRTIHLAVGNGRHYGGGMILHQDSQVDDRRLDVYSLEVENIWSLLRLLPALKAGTTQDWHEIRTLEGQVVTVRTRRPRSINADGEIVTKTPATFKVMPGVIEVFAPVELSRPAQE